jgi:Xaa-Pro dipeptidase
MPAVIAPSTTLVQSKAELQDERESKLEMLRSYLAQRGLDAVLLRRNENLAWATAGAVDRRVLLPAETGVPALLICRDGRRFCLAPNNEAPRLRDEDFAGLEFEFVVSPWHTAFEANAIERLVGTPRVAADTFDTLSRRIDLASLRASLSETEIARYRWLGSETAAAVAGVLVELKPGATEREMAAEVAYALMERDIEPSVLLMAVDDRIRKYKHALPYNGRLQRFGMINLCARKWGLAVSLTRFVHFGGMPEELRRGFDAAQRVYAALLDGTRPGATAADLFSRAREAYRAAGFPGGEEQHHQGGATGYWEREWLATPDGTEVVVDAQAFAWNPSAQGGKVEDTVLLRGGAMETLTPTPSLPTAMVGTGDPPYVVADVLLRD